MQNKAFTLLLFLFFSLTSQAEVFFSPAIPSDSIQTQGLKAPAGFHLVQKGDTYYRLSRIYKVPVDSLLKWNGTNLPVGQTIQVSQQKSMASASKPAVVAQPESTTLPGTKPVTKATSPATTAKPAIPASNTLKRYDEADKYAVSNKVAQRVLVVPFDPYLYFSDADDDIAWQSRVPKQNIRQIFRARLNAFIDPKGYETINLLGGVFRDSVDEINKIYKSLSYSYQDIKPSKYNQEPDAKKPVASGASTWLQKQKEKIVAPTTGPIKAPSVAKDETKYYGVKVKDPDLYTHFNKHYGVDYYLFVNQFEIQTDYNSCLDRVAQNFVREFVVHYTILNSKGELISGNKIKIPYVSNVNAIDKIVRDNLSKMAQRILSDLPRPQEITQTSAQVR